MRQQSSQQMLTLALCGLCSLICMINAVPLPAGNQELDVLQIPLANGKEIDVLTLGAKDQEQLIADRNKRTIGLLRELFPDITKEVNMQINRLVNNILQHLGPIVLGTVLNPTLERNEQRLFAIRNEDSDTDTDDDDDNNADDDDKNTDSDKDYESLPPELTNFEPDLEFESTKKKDT
ncbi:uncharacterized protein LOC115627793 isoform X6 [Scaptodrosophila lebanonensis]|uniref:Uncharacterized protein LOC115627793 isoform X6 n=1 Tax=Drosophila lebanonensis TaxID=7225 RepID=A0A6J2TTS7_DROLE|nr:uncharacterized protein LOC115627793 isoform X6 [Scaptodrosophila lebanonensis]